MEEEGDESNEDDYDDDDDDDEDDEGEGPWMEPSQLGYNLSRTVRKRLVPTVSELRNMLDWLFNSFTRYIGWLVVWLNG